MRYSLKYVLVLLFFGLICIHAAALKNKVAENSEKVSIHLTDKEKQFLTEHPVITAHNEADYIPYNFSEKGVAKGFSIDYLNLLAKRLGIKIKYISGHTWAEFMEMARKDEIDVMLNIMRTPEREKTHLQPEKENPICSLKVKTSTCSLKEEKSTCSQKEKTPTCSLKVKTHFTHTSLIHGSHGSQAVPAIHVCSRRLAASAWVDAQLGGVDRCTDRVLMGQRIHLDCHV